MVKIKGIDGRDYIIEDLDRFISHLEDFHTVNGKADGSLHEENGYYFEDFFKKTAFFVIILCFLLIINNFFIKLLLAINDVVSFL